MAIEYLLSFMRPRSNKTNANGKVRKNIALAQPVYHKAEEIIRHDKRPRPLSVLLEDLLDAEYDRLFSKRKAQAA